MTELSNPLIPATPTPTAANPARVIIFGATGGTGAHVLDRALAEGHQVTVFVRTPARVTIAHPRLQVVQGDVLEPAAVEVAIAEHDAVICALGAPPFNRERLRERGTQNIVDAMERLGLRRLVVLSGYGAGETFETLPFFLRRVVVPLYLSGVFADHNAQEEVVRRSTLEWTLVRPPTLTNGEARGDFQCTPLLDKATSTLQISRADVGAFMVAQLETNEHVGAAPAIAY